MEAVENGEIKKGEKTVAVLRYLGPKGGPGESVSHGVSFSTWRLLLVWELDPEINKFPGTNDKNVSIRSIPFLESLVLFISVLSRSFFCGSTVFSCRIIRPQSRRLISSPFGKSRWRLKRMSSVTLSWRRAFRASTRRSIYTSHPLILFISGWIRYRKFVPSVATLYRQTAFGLYSLWSFNLSMCSLRFCSY